MAEQQRRHCFHANIHAEAPEYEMICCRCGHVVPMYDDLPWEHGPHANWLHDIKFPEGARESTCDGKTLREMKESGELFYG